MTAGSLVLASIITSLRLPAARFVAGGIGAGLAYSALSDSCAMGNVLSRLPYNQGPAELQLDHVLDRLPPPGYSHDGEDAAMIPLAIALAVLVGVTSAAGAVSHARAGRVQWRTGLIFGTAGLIGAYAGGRASHFVPAQVLLIGFALMMIVTAAAMLRGRREVDPRQGAPPAASGPHPVGRPRRRSGHWPSSELAVGFSSSQHWPCSEGCPCP